MVYKAYLTDIETLQSERIKLTGTSGQLTVAVKVQKGQYYSSTFNTQTTQIAVASTMKKDQEKCSVYGQVLVKFVVIITLEFLHKVILFFFLGENVKDL